MSALKLEPDYRNITSFRRPQSNSSEADLKSDYLKVYDIEDECEYLDHSELGNEHLYLDLQDGSCNKLNDEENYYSTIQPRRRWWTSKHCALLCAILILLLGIAFGVLIWRNFVLTNREVRCPPGTRQLQCRREFVRKMALDAWNAYRKYAWGHSALKPVTKSPSYSWFGSSSGYSIVTAMSTLHVMELADAWEQGKRWIETELNFATVDMNVNTALVVTDYIGGLLSAYALSGDALFRRKALEIANILKPAFNSSTGMPYYEYNPKRQVASDNENFLSYICHQQPELIFLANITNDSFWQNQIQTSHRVMQQIDKPNGLLLNMINVDNGSWANSTASLFFDSSDFYYNLILSSIAQGQYNVNLMQMYSEAVDSLIEVQLLSEREDGLTYAVEYNQSSNLLGKVMKEDACRLGAMLGLGAFVLEKLNHSNASLASSNDSRTAHWQLALKLTETCRQMAEQTSAKLVPDSFMMANIIKTNGFLRQDSIESYFILWRLTGDEQYREYAWQMAEAIYAHCRTSGGGYSGILDVNSLPTVKDDYQPVNFLAQTLKYLYLIFSDSTVMPLDQWIFSTRGHPLPVYGKDSVYFPLFLETKRQREFIRSMTRDAWKAYRTYAWGHEALRPLSKLPDDAHFGSHSGASIVAAMSTLYVMKLQDEWEQGKQWIEGELNFDEINSNVAVKDVLAQFIGGLLSCYALSGEEAFMKKAHSIASIMKPAFNTSTGLPFYQINPKQQTVNEPNVMLANLAYQSPELLLLANLTDDAFWPTQLSVIAQFMQQIDKPNGLYMSLIDVQTGQWATKLFTLLGSESDFYLNLLLTYIQSSGQKVDVFKAFTEAIRHMLKNNVFQTLRSGLIYITDLDVNAHKHGTWMHHSACRFGAMLALGADQLEKLQVANNSALTTLSSLYWGLAVNMTETCYQLANETLFNLQPSVFNRTISQPQSEVGGLMSLYLAENYFILWRLTHQQRYRNYAWQMAQAIGDWCRTASGGYTNVNVFNRTQLSKQNYQPPYLLSATLKYLYLTFTDDAEMSLDRWFFNTQGHPLPICGKHELC